LPADELRDRVSELDTFWGRSAWDLRDQLLAAITPRAKFQHLEHFLVDRLRRSESAVYGRARAAWAVQRFLREPHGMTISDVVGETGISRKHFIAEFRRHVGLTPI
jgi:AraC-like DNA-binding protein